MNLIKNLHVDSFLKYKLLDYEGDNHNNLDNNLDNNLVIKKRYTINFIIYTYTCYNLINDKRKGNTENEINIMCNLTKTCEVYYNDVYINDLLDENLKREKRLMCFVLRADFDDVLAEIELKCFGVV